MLMDLETFGNRIQFDKEAFLDDLVAHTHRNTPAERAAWRSSLPTLWQTLSHPSLQGLHLQLGQRGGIAVEYRLPAVAFWIDAVLLGHGQSGPAAVIIELKDWKTSDDRPGTRPGLIHRSGVDQMHPSDQVQGYVEYCRRFHSAVQESNAAVAGCAYFTFARDVTAYRAEPHSRLVSEFPVFGQNKSDVTEALPAFIRKHLVRPDADFARKFDTGEYKQDRGLIKQVSAAIKRPALSPFVLLDKQREGFEKCMAVIEERLKPARKSARTSKGKSVIVVEGPPGSGKSIIAAHLWASLGVSDKVSGNVVLTTTCTAQRSNWQELFVRASGARAAKGIVVGSNSYNPRPESGLAERGACQGARGHAGVVAGEPAALSPVQAEDPLCRQFLRSFHRGRSSCLDRSDVRGATRHGGVGMDASCRPAGVAHHSRLKGCGVPA